MLVPLSVADCMTREVETIERDATAREVARRLTRSRIGSLVVREDHRPVGIVTESDLVRLLAEDAPVDERTVREIMSGDLVTIGPEAPLERAAELFEAHDFRRLPVVDDGELVGIVTTTDLADYFPSVSRRNRDVGSSRVRSDRLPAENPEMAYDLPDWEFESRETDNDVGVGDVVRFRKELTDADVRAFAEASGDTNRLHLDDEFAAGTRFGRRIAHGVLTTGLVSAALARLPGLTIYLSQNLHFLGPVGVGDVATAACSIVEDLGGDRYRLDVAVYDEDGEAVVEGESVVLIDPLPEDVETAARPLS